MGHVKKYFGEDTDDIVIPDNPDIIEDRPLVYEEEPILDYVEEPTSVYDEEQTAVYDEAQTLAYAEEPTAAYDETRASNYAEEWASIRTEEWESALQARAKMTEEALDSLQSRLVAVKGAAAPAAASTAPIAPAPQTVAPTAPAPQAAPAAAQVASKPQAAAPAAAPVSPTPQGKKPAVAPAASKPQVKEPVVAPTAPTPQVATPAVASAPQVTTPAVAPAAAPVLRNNRLIFGLEPVLPYSIEEAINRLRINISFLGTDVKKIMIISSEPNEGKSFVALNLWKQMAIAGEPTILVDLDMRKSVMVTKYQLKREDGQELKGTSHFLSSDEPIEDVILHTKYEYGDILPNVDNIVNPSMLLESSKFTEMMQYMGEHYRYAFIDAPPLGLVSDGELIGSVCDGAVLNVRGGVTSRNIVRRSIQQLERAGCPVLGIVLNRVGGAGSTYYHKYYGSKNYYTDSYYASKD